MYKALVGCAVTILILLIFLKSLYTDLQALKEQNKSLHRTIEANLQAAIEKDKRNKDELEQLQKELTELSRIDNACLSSPVDDDLVVFLQQLQQNSAGTISFTFTK